MGCSAFIDHDGHILQLQFEPKSTPASSLPHCPSPLSTSTTGGLKPSISSPVLKSPSSPLAQSVFVASALGPGSSTSPVPPSVSPALAIRAPRQLRQVSSRATRNEFPMNGSSSSSLFGPNGSSRSPAIARTQRSCRHLCHLLLEEFCPAVNPHFK